MNPKFLINQKGKDYKKNMSFPYDGSRLGGKFTLPSVDEVPLIVEVADDLIRIQGRLVIHAIGN